MDFWQWQFVIARIARLSVKRLQELSLSLLVQRYKSLLKLITSHVNATV